RGRLYRYSVKACTAWACSYRSMKVAVRTPSAPPRRPAGVQGAWRTLGGIKISWLPSGGATKYRVVRDGAIRAWHLHRTTYVDSGVRRSNTYRYGVRACNSVGCSWQSQVRV